MPLNGKAGRTSSSVRERSPSQKNAADPPSTRFRENGLFLGLIFVTGFSSLLLASSVHGWILPVYAQTFVTKNRATTQIIVQVLSSIFGFLQFAPICSLINRATRLHIAKKEASLDDLRFWSLLVSRGLGWDLPLKRLLALLLFLLFAINPAAVWVGALTPVDKNTFRTAMVMIPSYENVSLIHEYPSEFNNQADEMEVRTTKGLFTYDVGMRFQGALLSSGSDASTVDGSPRQHKKLDNTGMTYDGRSYGVGAAVGLDDDDILNDNLIVGYQYQEPGYSTEVSCIYNTTSAFQVFEIGPGYPFLWQASGTLPNSDAPELSDYVGHDGSAIVAIGVAAGAINGSQYLAIAAGSSYSFLNSTQCVFTFVPTLFNVSVAKQTSTITVTPGISAPNIDETNMLAHTSVRQFELIANDQTNLYQSLVGTSIFSSIANYKISQTNRTLTDDEAYLNGLTNSMTAMVDDMLGLYASAQIMVGGYNSSTTAEITVLSMRVGQPVYIFAEIIVNCIILLIVLEEAIRTQGWKGLGVWDYMDIRNVVTSSSRGGRGVAEEIDEEEGEGTGMKGWRDSVWKILGGDDALSKTKVRFERETGALVLVKKEEKESDKAWSGESRIELLKKGSNASGATGEFGAWL
jgi:hypothetical protein